jgi:3-deoxy-7-phosphoheptulonate synthase
MVVDPTHDRARAREPEGPALAGAVEFGHEWGVSSWTPDSWQARPVAQAIPYAEADAGSLKDILARLRSLPPLVTPWEIDRLRAQIAEAQEGRRFILQGGDCAESFSDCKPDVIVSNLKILLQMSLVLIHGGKRPVTRVGRFAGQYTKPRSQPSESQGALTLPSYFGDSVNAPAFEAEARRPDPVRLLTAHQHAALTLNYVRSLSAGGFADLRHPEYWDLSFLERADLSPELRAHYQHVTREIEAALEFMKAALQTSFAEASRVEFFTSHEGLNLHYEAAMTRTVEHLKGYYDLSTHLPWIGERTRRLDGAHVEFFRGIENPIGVKLGPNATPGEVLELCAVLNPDNLPGRLVFITRMGKDRVKGALPPLVRAARDAKRRVLWLSDPMHGNTRVTQSGVKTRHLDDIFAEIEQTFEAHRSEGLALGGIHFELTGEDVTECTGGGLLETDLARNYASLCDPRLNYRQALEIALRVARQLPTP